MTKIIVTVRGGNIENITATEEVEVMVIDWDNIADGDEFPTDFYSPDLIIDETKIPEFLDISKTEE